MQLVVASIIEKAMQMQKTLTASSNGTVEYCFCLKRTLVDEKYINYKGKSSSKKSMRIYKGFATC